MFGRLDVDRLQRDYVAKPLSNDLADRFDHQFDPLLDTLSTAQTKTVRVETAHKIMEVFRALYAGPLTPGFHPIKFKGRFQRFMDLIEDLFLDDQLSWSSLDVMVIPAEQKAEVEALKTVIFTEPKTLYYPRGGLFGDLSVNNLQRDYLAGDA